MWDECEEINNLNEGKGTINSSCRRLPISHAMIMDGTLPDTERRTEGKAIHLPSQSDGRKRINHPFYGVVEVEPVEGRLRLLAATSVQHPEKQISKRASKACVNKLPLSMSLDIYLSSRCRLDLHRYLLFPRALNKLSPVCASILFVSLKSSLRFHGQLPFLALLL